MLKNNFIKDIIPQNNQIHFKYKKNISFKSKIDNNNNINLILGNDLNVLQFYQSKQINPNIIYFSIEDFKDLFLLDSEDIYSDLVQEHFMNLFKSSHSSLSDDGVIIVHVKDKNSLGVREKLSSIFGISNYITTFIWDNLFKSSNFVNTISTSNEFFYVFAKNKSKFEVNKNKSKDVSLSEYNLSDEFSKTRGNFKLSPLDTKKGKMNDYAKPVYLDGEMYYPSGKESTFSKSNEWSWLYPTEKIQDLFEKGYIVIQKINANQKKLFIKEYEKVDVEGNEKDNAVNFNNFILNTSNKKDKKTIDFKSNSKEISNIVPKDVFKILSESLFKENDFILQLSTKISNFAVYLAYLNMSCDLDIKIVNVSPSLNNKLLDSNFIFNSNEKSSEIYQSNLNYLFNSMYKYSKLGKEDIENVICNIQLFEIVNEKLDLDFDDVEDIENRYLDYLKAELQLCFGNLVYDNFKKLKNFDLIYHENSEQVILISLDVFATKEILKEVFLLTRKKKHILFCLNSFKEDKLTSSSKINCVDIEYFYNLF